MKFLKEQQHYIFTFLLILILLRTCSISNDERILKAEQEKMGERLDSLNKRVVDGPTLDKKLEDRMWQALELEEMGDNGRKINDLKNQYRKN